MTAPIPPRTLPAIDWRWVDAAPFRAQLRHLLSETGLPWRALASCAGVPDRVVRALVRGRDGRPLRRIAPHYAHRLLQLEPAGLTDALRALTPAGPARDAAHQLLGARWPATRIAAVAELTDPEVEALLLGRVARVPLRVEVLLGAAVRAHQLTPLEPPQCAELDLEGSLVAA